VSPSRHWTGVSRLDWRLDLLCVNAHVDSLTCVNSICYYLSFCISVCVSLLTLISVFIGIARVLRLGVISGVFGAKLLSGIQCWSLYVDA